MRFYPLQIIILFILFLSGLACAQLTITDSLEQKLRFSEGQERVDILNQLTYELITIDNDKVIEYGSLAISLSKKIGYLKGEGKAYTYKGVNEYITGRFPEAHWDLNRGLRIARQTGDRALQGYALLQLGNCSLEEVQRDSALIFFKGSYEIFKDSSDPTTLSKLYRNISALYGQRYQPDSQRLYLNKAIEIRKLLPNKILLAEALLLKSNITLKKGDIQGAEKILNEVETFIGDQLWDNQNRNDFRHLKALILFQKGQYEDASILFDSARNYYLRSSLLRKYVTLLIDLGRVFSDRGEYELALNNLYDALRLSKHRGFEAESGIIRNRIGWVNFQLGDLQQSLLMSKEALLVKKLLPADRAGALMLKGVVLTDMKKYNEARLCLDSVLQIFRNLNDQRGTSEALMNLGFLESRLLQYDEAIDLYDKSIRLASAIPYNYGLAWSYWGLGDIYVKLGNYKLSTQYLDQSLQYARLLDANEIIILNYYTRRDLLAAQNKFKEALQYSIMASQLKDSLHRTDVARRFVNLEKIQEIEQRDRDIQGLQKDKQLAEDKIQLQEVKLRQQSILIIVSVVGITLISVLAYLYYRFYSRIKILNISITEKNNRIQEQSDRLHDVNLELKNLYQEVSLQKEKIQQQADELTVSNQNINEINRSLEKLVAEKTIELRTTNEELTRRNTELLQFSYTVSHNLRGPVARLLGLSSLVRSEQDIQHAKQWIGLIDKTTSDLDLIIKDLSKLLDIRNSVHQHREVVNLQLEWNQSLSLLQDGLSGSEEITNNFEAVPSVATVRAMLQSIFYNLLSNAIKFRSPERNLHVSGTSRIENDSIVIEITDNGLGFNTELHGEKLFKLYRRFHTHVEGRGLGLYLIKSQLDILQGTIEVNSIPDQGTIFKVMLPLRTEDPKRNQVKSGMAINTPVDT